MKRNDPCWCGSGKKYKKCHEDFDARIDEMKFISAKNQVRPPRRLINNAADIEGIKRAAVINTGALDLMSELVREGVDTLTLNNAAHEFIVSHGANPSCLNFEGYPKSICISVNNVVCHGIPSRKEILKAGDILNIDITTDLDGYFADASRMYTVGEISAEAQRLIDVTREIMEAGIAAAKPWHFVGDIGAACGKMAHDNGYSVVTDLGGHGVGKAFHLEPFVSHDCRADTGMLLVPGIVLTVEPMINAGKKKVTTDSGDHWTVRTLDGSLSAQWEKTILITETGTEVLAS
ncbi:MAG: methionyl aminopeptidase [Selenomonadaceae bacterium]|nr:methionyl aminopeptidase [Selenomonadaceae bacterium]